MLSGKLIRYHIFHYHGISSLPCSLFLPSLSFYYVPFLSLSISLCLYLLIYNSLQFYIQVSFWFFSLPIHVFFPNIVSFIDSSFFSSLLFSKDLTIWWDGCEFWIWHESHQPIVWFWSLFLIIISKTNSMHLWMQ